MDIVILRSSREPSCEPSCEPKDSKGTALSTPPPVFNDETPGHQGNISQTLLGIVFSSYITLFFKFIMKYSLWPVNNQDTSNETECFACVY